MTPEDPVGHGPAPSPSRSALMSRIRGANTNPELVVRRVAHSLGFRFRLHGKGLPGRPDLVFARLRRAVFVHGCYWHRHAGCRRSTTPKTRVAFWTEKFATNVARDARVLGELKALGWSTLVVWECETTDTASLSRRLQRFLSASVCR
jgi:DNA mismatch endonuclease, patch repair protein